MNNWILVSDRLPILIDRTNECLWPSSDTVLTVNSVADIQLATLEQLDPDGDIRWCSHDSERWYLTDIVWWMPLPPLPDGLANKS